MCLCSCLLSVPHGLFPTLAAGVAACQLQNVEAAAVAPLCVGYLYLRILHVLTYWVGLVGACLCVFEGAYFVFCLQVALSCPACNPHIPPELQGALRSQVFITALYLNFWLFYLAIGPENITNAIAQMQ